MILILRIMRRKMPLFFDCEGDNSCVIWILMINEVCDRRNWTLSWNLCFLGAIKALTSLKSNQPDMKVSCLLTIGKILMRNSPSRHPDRLSKFQGIEINEFLSVWTLELNFSFSKIERSTSKVKRRKTFWWKFDIWTWNLRRVQRIKIVSGNSSGQLTSPVATVSQEIIFLLFYCNKK